MTRAFSQHAAKLVSALRLSVGRQRRGCEMLCEVAATDAHLEIHGAAQLLGADASRGTLQS